MDRGSSEVLGSGIEMKTDVELKSDGQLTGSGVPKTDSDVDSELQ